VAACFGERVWARPLGGDRFVLENAPWFARGFAEGDTVRAVASSDGVWPTVLETLEWSGNLTIRVIPFSSGPLGGSLQRVLDAFRAVGVTGEGAGIYPMVALTVPPSADRIAVKGLLEQGVEDEWWEFEEGCVDDAWLAM
jgi:Domain of unknown function (DUF4265)